MALCGSELYLEEGLKAFSDEDIIATKRINLDYAGKAKDYPWRFAIKNSPFL